MAEVEKRPTAEAGEEDERLLMEEMTVLDFDMLCSTVAMQAHQGKWGKLNGDIEEENFVSDYRQYGGGVLRMWEGDLIYDCFDDQSIALQSTCCPCYRFGKNMNRAGFGSCFVQGLIYVILGVIAMANMVAFITTDRRCFLYVAISFMVSVGAYLGYYRMQIRNKFNIKGGESSFDDCVYHMICPCCTLCQESRTLEMNNVQDGIWHGRGADTICIGGTVSDLDTKPFIVSTKSPQFLSMEKSSNECLSTSVVEDPTARE